MSTSVSLQHAGNRIPGDGTRPARRANGAAVSTRLRARAGAPECRCGSIGRSKLLRLLASSVKLGASEFSPRICCRPETSPLFLFSPCKNQHATTRGRSYTILQSWPTSSFRFTLEKKNVELQIQPVHASSQHGNSHRVRVLIIIALTYSTAATVLKSVRTLQRQGN